MAQIPIMDKDIFLMYVLCGSEKLEFDFQSPINTPGVVFTKNVRSVTGFEIRFWIGKKHPFKPRFNIQMQIKGPQNPFIPNNI